MHRFNIKYYFSKKYLLINFIFLNYEKKYIYNSFQIMTFH